VIGDGCFIGLKGFDFDLVCVKNKSSTEQWRFTLLWSRNLVLKGFGFVLNAWKTKAAPSNDGSHCSGRGTRPI